MNAEAWFWIGIGLGIFGVIGILWLTFCAVCATMLVEEGDE
jgi:hypothetical protein